MIFEDLEYIKSLPIDRKKELIKSGSYEIAIKEPPLLRSNMMVNPLNLKHLNRIDNLEADMITLNLEDGVNSAKKEEALVNIALFLSHLKSSNSFITIRVNSLDNGGLNEIWFLKDFRDIAFRISKVRSNSEILEVEKIVDNPIDISVETKETFFDFVNWKFRQLRCVNLGILDLLVDLKLPQSLLKINNPLIVSLLVEFLLNAKRRDLYPISFTYQEYNNLEEFRSWCEFEKSLGYRAKSAIGPKQVKIINEIFNTPFEELKRAKEIKELFEEAQKRGDGFVMDSRYGFIDEPIYRDALNILGGSLKK